MTKMMKAVLVVIMVVLAVSATCSFQLSTCPWMLAIAVIYSEIIFLTVYKQLGK
jgi:uncharacterized membrane protein